MTFILCVQLKRVKWNSSDLTCSSAMYECVQLPEQNALRKNISEPHTKVLNALKCSTN